VEQFLQQLEASLGVPAELIERAAAARAGVTGASAENVVRAWAGEGEAPAGGSPAEEAPAAAAAATPAAEPAPAATEAASGPVVEVLEATEPVPEPESDTEEEQEATGVLAGFPGWLAAALLAVPILALSYVLIAPNGPGCGSSGQLAIDAETGLAENCDGSEYGVDAVSFFSIGQDVYNGAGRCAGCHGEAGGGGTGPAMSGGAVLATFPADQCSEHIRWVSIGSDNWPDATYGATNKTVNGGMPAAGQLSPEQLAAVIIYERVAFGGQSLADAEMDCGTDELEIAGGE